MITHYKISRFVKFTDFSGFRQQYVYEMFKAGIWLYMALPAEAFFRFLDQTTDDSAKMRYHQNLPIKGCVMPNRPSVALLKIR